MDVISNVREIKHKNNEYESIKLTTQTDNRTVNGSSNSNGNNEK